MPWGFHYDVNKILLKKISLVAQGADLIFCPIGDVISHQKHDIAALIYEVQALSLTN